MHIWFELVSEYIALGAEVGATVLIAIGVIEALARVATQVIGQGARAIKDVWLRLAGWILLSLEFALAADIVRTSIAPTWEDVGKLAAIAAIRTVLSVFLERDLSSLEREQRNAAKAV